MLLSRHNIWKYSVITSLHFFVFLKIFAKQQERDVCLATLWWQYTHIRKRLTLAFLVPGLITECQTITDEIYFY